MKRKETREEKGIVIVDIKRISKGTSSKKAINQKGN